MAKKLTHKRLEKQVKRLRSRISDYYQGHSSELLNYKQLAARLELKEPLEKQILVSVIEAMVKDELLAEEQRGKFKWTGPLNETEGIIQFTRSGMAFVEIQGQDVDVMISENMTGTALNTDIVKIKMIGGGGRKSRAKGKVIGIVERSRTTFACVIFKYRDQFFAKPDNPKINVDFLIPKDGMNGAKEGEKVIVELTEWTDSKKNPIGSISEVLGMPGDMRAESDSILADYGFPLRFPEAVEQECEAISKVISKEEVSKRKDLRDTLTFTIDPEDAKDFDDAISFKKLDNGHLELGVHIADVAHYVTEGSATEKEAQKRATSIYLVDRVIPMLPEVLSNKLCSLRPHEDKLCFSVLFEMDEKGNVHKHWVGKTVIHSDHRFVYEEVQEILEGKSGKFEEELRTTNSLAKQMRERRMDNGAIAFDKAEVKFKLDESKKPIDVFFKVQNDANKLIEEFMLLANRTVAQDIGKKKDAHHQVKTFVYRTHDRPDVEKLKEFADFIKRFGYRIDLNNPDRIAQTINSLLKMVKGKPEQNIIELLAIRTMAKAEYTTHNIGHFGLAFPYYSHFTSPIRRYPDVMTHRLLFSYLNGGKSENQDSFEKLCKHSSMMERKASEAERESGKFYQVVYMKDQVGETFDGVISGVTEWGIFVEIESNKCEGLVRLRDIDGDYYTYDQKNMRIIGQRTDKIFQLGQKVKIKIENADLASRRIDMKLVD